MNKKILLITIFIALSYFSIFNVYAFSNISEKQNSYTSTEVTEYEVSDYGQLIDLLQEAILNDKEISVKYVKENAGDISPFVIWDNIFGESIDAEEDYLDNLVDFMTLTALSGLSVDENYNIVSDKNSLTLKFTNINYSYTNSIPDMEFINKRLDEIVDELDLKYLTTYEKVKKVHDWICENFKYDDSMENESLIEGFNEGSFICSTYSSLAYNILSRAGVNVRLIYGNTGGYHGWNLVQMNDGLWYHLDITWDDSLNSNDYFLVGDKIYLDHKIDTIFVSSINKYYPISKTNYVYTPPVSPTISEETKDFYYEEKSPKDIVINGISFNDSTDFDLFLNETKIEKSNYQIISNENNYDCIISKDVLNTFSDGQNVLKFSFNDDRHSDFKFNINIKKIKYPQFNLNKKIYLGCGYTIHIDNLSKDAKIEYKSSNTKILEVDKIGRVYPNKTGKASILCEINQSGYIYKFNIDFIISKTSSSISTLDETIKIKNPVKNPIVTLKTDMSLNEVVGFSFLDVEKDSKITYKISNKNVISVNNNEIIAIGNGETYLTINVNQNNQKYTYKLLISVD